MFINLIAMEELVRIHEIERLEWIKSANRAALARSGGEKERVFGLSALRNWIAGFRSAAQPAFVAMEPGCSGD